MYGSGLSVVYGYAIWTSSVANFRAATVEYWESKF